MGDLGAFLVQLPAPGPVCPPGCAGNRNFCEHSQAEGWREGEVSSGDRRERDGGSQRQDPAA